MKGLMYTVVDINDNQIYGEFDTLEEAENFIEEDQNDHNLTIRIYDWDNKIWLD